MDGINQQTNEINVFEVKTIGRSINQKRGRGGGGLTFINACHDQKKTIELNSEYRACMSMTAPQ